MKNTTELFTARFDAAQIYNLCDVSDAIIAMATRAETTLLLLTDLAECTGQGESRETVAIYGAITELNDIQDLTNAYRDHIKQEPKTTPNTDSGGAVMARIHEISALIQEYGAIE